jgi:hypothetical protein
VDGQHDRVIIDRQPVDGDRVGSYPDLDTLPPPGRAGRPSAARPWWCGSATPSRSSPLATGGPPIQASRRWHLERTNAWHNAFNRLQRCYERREKVIDAYFDLADAIITRT